jgi:hypothetical protein
MQVFVHPSTNETHSNKSLKVEVGKGIHSHAITFQSGEDTIHLFCTSGQLQMIADTITAYIIEDESESLNVKAEMAEGK